MGTGIGNWDWGLGNGEWENGKWEIESTPVPGDDSIMPGATHPTTFNHKEDSDNKVPLVKIKYLRMIPLTYPAQKMTRWTATITNWGSPT